MGQRYDEFADWYDTYVTSGLGQPFARSSDRLLERLLGPGYDRLCLDLGCGGGAHVPVLTRLGWRVTGVDISARQIDLARRTGITATVANAEGLLRPSMLAMSEILTSPDSLAPGVPEAAIVREGELAHVWVVHADGVLEQRAILTGRSNGALTEVRQGLKAGERIVTSGSLFIDSAAQPD